MGDLLLVTGGRVLSAFARDEKITGLAGTRSM